jgi:hypothetical protein
VLRHALLSRTLSPELSRALLGLACLAADVQATEAAFAESQISKTASLPPVVVHPAALGIVMQLLRSCPDQQLRTTTLASVLAWVEGSVVNAAAVVSHRGWQAWLLQLLYSDILYFLLICFPCCCSIVYNIILVHELVYRAFA